MHLINQIPVLVLHILKADIAQDTGVVDEHVHAAEVLNCGVDDGFAVLDAVIVGDGFAAGGADFVYHDICGLFQSISIGPLLEYRTYGVYGYTFDDLPSPA